jgi:plastocyanin
MMRWMIFVVFFLSCTGYISGFAADSTGSVSGKVQISENALRPLKKHQSEFYYGKPSRQTPSNAKDRREAVIKDLVVFIADQTPSDGRFADRSYLSPDAETTAEMVQLNKAFIPHVLPILIGTTVSFPNKDPFYHNVFSYSGGNKFDLGKYSRETPPKNFTFMTPGFKKPGVVEIFCDIHRHMRAYILVLENPFFTQPDSDENFQIDEIPPGNWQIFVWHPVLKDVSRPVEIKAGATVDLKDPIVIER